MILQDWRFGGEELAIVLPQTPDEGAVEVARQLSEQIRRCRIPHRDNPLGYLTVSIGCPTIVPARGQHPSVLMQQADDALYEAKRSGRNQVMNACDPSRRTAVPKVG